MDENSLGAGMAEELRSRPYRLSRPLRQTVPLVFAFPHSGQIYPPAFVAASQLSARALRRSEDAFVDVLLEPAVLALGAPAILARFPRAYVDVNRGPGELDPTMFDGCLGVSVDPPGARVQAGLGVIPRIVRDGAEIYARPLPACEAGERLGAYYQPYHGGLLALVEQTYASFGAAVVVDCHSMPSVAAAPDIVLGDRFGSAAAPSVIAAAQAAFEAVGLRVARNVPYAGGFTTQLYGRPGRGIHALQIEINRGLYLDEDTVRPGPGFAGLKARMAAALATFVRACLASIRPAGTPLPWAAE